MLLPLVVNQTKITVPTAEDSDLVVPEQYILSMSKLDAKFTCHIFVDFVQMPATAIAINLGAQTDGWLPIIP